jgi:hypothetical protein
MRIEQPGRRQRRDRGIRAGQRDHPEAGGAHRDDRTRAGIGNARACRHRRSSATAFAGASFSTMLLGSFVLVVLVQRNVSALGAVMLEQRARVARVLGGDPDRRRAGFPARQGQVAEIPERRGTTYNAADSSMSGILAQSKGAAGEQLAADYLQRRACS